MKELAILIMSSSLSVRSLWIETELNLDGSMVDRIHVLTLLPNEKVLSAVELDAWLTARILQILQSYSTVFFGFW